MNRNCGLIAVVVALAMLAGAAQGTEKGRLLVGAAKADITPPMDKGIMMSGYSGRNEPADGVHDHLYCRAIVVEDGTTSAAIVTADVTGVDDRFCAEVADRIEAETKIPRGNILIAAIHSHAAPRCGGNYDDPESGNAVYARSVADAMVGAAKAAQAGLGPGLMSVGTGTADININRRARLEGGEYWLGQNPAAVSDKTVHVLKFAREDGTPVAMFINYPVHCVAMGPRNLKISGDIGGATSRYVEEQLGGEVVAAWTSGAAGDQNPIYPPGDNYKYVPAMGEILGEEVLRVAESLRMSAVMQIQAVQQVLSVPGKKTTPSKYQPDGNYEIADADPVNVRLSVLMLNHVALCGVSGEVLTSIGLRLKAESPFNQTIMVTHCNGSGAGYIPDDAAYAIMSYEIATSRVKPGAEGLIIDAFMKTLDAY